MNTFQLKLVELQNEQKSLLSSSDRRKKVVRDRIHAITKEFYDVKAQWRGSNKENKICGYEFA